MKVEFILEHNINDFLIKNIPVIKITAQEILNADTKGIGFKEVYQIIYTLALRECFEYIIPYEIYEVIKSWAEADYDIYI